ADGDDFRVSDEWARRHSEFHAALVASCDSPWLLRIRATLYAQSERYRRLSLPATRELRDVTSEHRAIMEAALAHDVVLVTHLLRDHLKLTSARVAALVSATGAGSSNGSGRRTSGRRKPAAGQNGQG